MNKTTITLNDDCKLRITNHRKALNKDKVVFKNWSSYFDELLSSYKKQFEHNDHENTKNMIGGENKQ